MPLTEKALRLIAARDTPPVPPAIPLGVYLSRKYKAALVAHADESGIHFVAMVSGRIDLMRWGIEEFKKYFVFPMPAYKVKEAAESYLEDEAEKTEKALKAINWLLRDKT